MGYTIYGHEQARTGKNTVTTSSQHAHKEIDTHTHKKTRTQSDDLLVASILAVFGITGRCSLVRNYIVNVVGGACEYQTFITTILELCSRRNVIKLARAYRTSTDNVDIYLMMYSLRHTPN